MEPTQPSTAGSDVPLSGCLLRIFWMGFGNAALVFAALHVAHGAELASANAIFFGVVAALMIARSLDVLRFSGTTTEGQPATVADLRRYAMGLVVTSGILWFIAYSVRGATD